MDHILLLFATTHAAIKAERLCMSEKLACKVIAVPRTISTECGIAIEIDEVNLSAVTGLFDANDIKHTIHRTITP